MSRNEINMSNGFAMDSMFDNVVYAWGWVTRNDVPTRVIHAWDIASSSAHNIQPINTLPSPSQSLMRSTSLTNTKHVKTLFTPPSYMRPYHGRLYVLMGDQLFVYI